MLVQSHDTSGLVTPHALPRVAAAWVAVLLGLADISETAWRKRLRASNAWFLWRRGALSTTPVPSAPAVPRPPERLVLGDASCLGQPGGTGDDWRLPLASDFLAGRKCQGPVTDRCRSERLDRYMWQVGDVLVADTGYGYRRRVAWAVQ